MGRVSITTAVRASGRQVLSVEPAVWRVPVTVSLPPLPTGSGPALREVIRVGIAVTVRVAAEVAVSPTALTNTAR